MAVTLPGCPDSRTAPARPTTVAAVDAPVTPGRASLRLTVNLNAALHAQLARYRAEVTAERVLVIHLGSAP